MSRKINAVAVQNAILKQARDDMAYARQELTEFQQRVARKTVTGCDRYEYMNGLAYWQFTTSLETLSGLCDELGLVRLERVLNQHVARLKRDFEALSERDRAQVCAARDAEHKARLAELRGQ